MELTVEQGAGERLDSHLADRLPDLSRSRIQQLIRERFILVNGQPAKPRQTVHQGDRISLAIPELVPAQAAPQDIPLHILHEDDDIVVIDKEPGMVVHPAAGNPDGTLVNALLHHCRNLSGIGGVERPGIVHRLDKDTSGCLVVAKNDRAHHALAAQFASRTTAKRYLAVTQSPPRPPQGTVFTHLGRHPVNRQKITVLTPPAGKPAITDYLTLATDGATGTALVLCDLHTGRTHQIRVHLLHLGCPLLGDAIYAKPARQPARPGRLMLHAWQLALDHPRDGRRMLFKAAIPPEFTPWIQGLDLAGVEVA